jgi:hypothetical protein
LGQDTTEKLPCQGFFSNPTKIFLEKTMTNNPKILHLARASDARDRANLAREYARMRQNRALSGDFRAEAARLDRVADRAQGLADLN